MVRNKGAMSLELLVMIVGGGDDHVADDDDHNQTSINTRGQSPKAEDNLICQNVDND